MRAPLKSQGPVRPPTPSRRRAAAVARPKSLAAARTFLKSLERQVLREIRTICASLSKGGHLRNPAELTDLADLPHVIAHWHDDRAYIDESGKPRRLPLDGPGISLAALIARVYPKKPVSPIVQGLLRTGIVSRRGRYFECTSRHIVFPASLAAYLTGLIPILGLVYTLRLNLSGEAKLFQRHALNSRIPVGELPALYRAIERRVYPALVATDVDMIRREGRGKPGEARARVGLAAQVFTFPGATWPLTRPASLAQLKPKLRKRAPR